MIIKRIKTNMRAALLSFAAFVVALSGVAAVSSTPASALSGTCASNGYGLVGQNAIYMTKGDGTKLRTGTLEVYYKSSTGKKCAMAKCSSGWCWNMYRVVAIKDGNNTAGWEGWDGGMYTSYAGPVVTSSSTRGRCIDVYAAFTQRAGDPDPEAFGVANLNNKYCN
jgi:hypothetical protein